MPTSPAYATIDALLHDLLADSGLSYEQRVSDLARRNHWISFPFMDFFSATNRVKVSALPNGRGDFFHPLVDPVLYYAANAASFNVPLDGKDYPPDASVYIIPFPLPHEIAFALTDPPYPIIIVNEYIILLSDYLFRHTRDFLDETLSEITPEQQPIDVSFFLELLSSDTLLNSSQPHIAKIFELISSVSSSIISSDRLANTLYRAVDIVADFIDRFTDFRCTDCSMPPSFEDYFFDSFGCHEGPARPDAYSDSFIFTFLGNIIYHEEYHFLADHRSDHLRSHLANYMNHIGINRADPSLRIIQELEADLFFLSRCYNYLSTGGTIEEHLIMILASYWAQGLPHIIQTYGRMVTLGRPLHGFERFLAMGLLHTHDRPISEIFSQHPSGEERLSFISTFNAFMALLDRNQEQASLAFHYSIIFLFCFGNIEEGLHSMTKEKKPVTAWMCPQCISQHPLALPSATLNRIQDYTHLDDNKKSDLLHIFDDIIRNPTAAAFSHLLLPKHEIIDDMINNGGLFPDTGGFHERD